MLESRLMRELVWSIARLLVMHMEWVEILKGLWLMLWDMLRELTVESLKGRSLMSSMQGAFGRRK